MQIFELVPEGPDLVEKNKSLLRATLDDRDYDLSDEFRVRLRRLLGIPDDELQESDVSEDRSDAAPED